ncbi:MAG: O-antigen ligase family protein [bacterium]|nr:O-antigen ligase family protein [bacterium]
MSFQNRKAKAAIGYSSLNPDKRVVLTKKKNASSRLFSALPKRKYLFQSKSTFLYLLVLFFLPTQLGKHFWPDFTTVLGIRVDYLSPTLYLTDILLMLLAVSCWKKVVSSLRRQGNSKNLYFFSKEHAFLFAGIIAVLAGSIFSVRPVVGFLGIARLLEVLFFAWYTGYFFSSSKHERLGIIVFSSALLLQGVVVNMQAYFQHSLGGVLYLLGERSISLTTPGAARSELHGLLYLRPYGTFSHPNTLAGFLLMGSILVMYEIFSRTRKGKLIKSWYAAAFVFSAASLFLTLSRTAISLAVLLIVAIAVKAKMRFDRERIMVVGVLLMVIAFFPLVYYRFLSNNIFGESLEVRLVLMEASLRMILDHPFFGVGINESLISLPRYLPQLSFMLLQPVHSLFLLIASESGVVGLLGFISALMYSFQKSMRERSLVKIFLLLSVCFLGLTDHYFLTQQQGRLLLGFIFGLILSNSPLRLPNKKKYSN